MHRVRTYVCRCASIVREKKMERNKKITDRRSQSIRTYFFVRDRFSRNEKEKGKGTSRSYNWQRIVKKKNCNETLKAVFPLCVLNRFLRRDTLYIVTEHKSCVAFFFLSLCRYTHYFTYVRLRVLASESFLHCRPPNRTRTPRKR